MSLNQLIKLCALSGVIALGVGVNAAQAQTIELKLSHFVPPNHAYHKWAMAWADQLAKDSGGRLKVTIYPNGQLAGPPNRQLDAARNGVADIAFVLHGVTPVANPIVFYSKVPIRKLDDFKGLKVRYAGIQNKYLLDALGAVPLLIPPSESQDALSKGIVDVATFPHEAAVSYDLGTVTKYAIEPGIATATFVMAMNPAKYDSLPADLKALIDKSSGPAAAESFGKAWEVAETEGRDKEIAQGVQMIMQPPEDVAKMKAMMAPHIEAAIGALEKDGKPARKFYEAYTK